ncbi:MAG: LPXTG cell wall anchor domain-containing protein [Oscillibacter sp.]
MSKNMNHKPVRRDTPLNGPMKFFLAGCVAELYLLIIRRFYIAGTMEQVVAWDAYLSYLPFVGLAVLIVGLVLGILWRKKDKLRPIGWSVFAVGAFLAASAWLLRTYYTAAMSFLCVAIPAVMLLSILWSLYDRECAWALTILGTAVAVLWICRKGVGTQMWNMQVRIGVVICLVLLAAVALLTWKVSKTGGRLGKLSLFPAHTDTLPIYVACGLSACAMVAALFSATIAYYAMWTLALVIFALAVYYTVKQL